MNWLGFLVLFCLASLLGSNLRRTGIAGTVFPLTTFVVGVGVGYFLNFSNGLPLHIFLPAILFGISLGYLLRYLFDLKFSRIAIVSGFRIALALLLGDFRVAALFVGLLISYFITFNFYELAIQGKSTDFWMSFFASWTSGLLFFTIVGLIAGLVTLYRPERDVFAARVKILLGGKSGPAVDFLARELGRIGYVARITQRSITVEDYDAEMDAFKIRVHHLSRIRNLYHDVATQAVGTIAFNFDSLTPAPDLLGQLTAFRLNGTSQPFLPIHFDAAAGVNRPWSLPISGGAEGTVEYEHWCWYKASEVHTFTLSRFTEELTVSIKSRCAPSQKRLKLNLTLGANNDEAFLEWDASYRVPSMKDQQPGTVPYSFKIGIGP